MIIVSIFINQLGQYAISAGSNAYCYTGLAISTPALAMTATSIQ